MNTSQVIKEGIDRSIKNYGLSSQYPWLKSSEDFNYEPIGRIAERVYTLTGLILKEYTLEGGQIHVFNWRHTLIFPFASSFPDSLNLKTLYDSMVQTVQSEFGDVPVSLKGEGFNIKLIITI